MENPSLVDDVKRYCEENGPVVDKVTEAFEKAGGDSADLDDLVYDVAGSYGASEANQTDEEDVQEQAIADFEAQASGINNGSGREQVAAILMGNGVEEGEALVMAAVPAAAPRA